MIDSIGNEYDAVVKAGRVLMIESYRLKDYKYRTGPFMVLYDFRIMAVFRNFLDSKGIQYNTYDQIKILLSSYHDEFTFWLLERGYVQSMRELVLTLGHTFPLGEYIDE